MYNYEERAFESFGNILSLKTISYKLYCKRFFKIPRYSYLVSSKCIDYFMQESFDEKIKISELNIFREKSITLDTFFDLLTLNEHLIENNLE